ncbi:MAG: glycoside hydrolase family 99-like domain-containing protein [Clostridia bacterium]|nr:glycoside hydrolase family 99-like domain-containing protein [Clostridia bacterium]
MKKYDIAAYIWPAYTGKEDRTLMFWPDGEGEWQTVRRAVKKCDDHILPRVPLLGYKDEAEPATMEEQIDLAASHGVNVFIYDWYWYDRRPFLENCLNDGFLQAKNNHKVKFYIMWANHDANYTWDKRLAGVRDVPVWLGAVDRAQFDVVTDRIIEKYFSRDNYYTIDGKPVFAIYDIDNLIIGLGGIQQTKAALDDFREKTIKAGHKGLHLQFIVWGEWVHNYSGVDGAHLYSSEIAKTLGFDSTTNYQYVHFVNIDRDYNEVMKDVVKEWERFSSFGVKYFPHVSIGWDNNPRFNSFRPGIMKNNTPKNIGEALKAAKEFADKHDARLITINSWNEWTEMSYLLPDDVYGTGYLDEIKKVFG